LVGVAALLAAGCYTYTPVASTPPPSIELAVDLTDRGRVAAAPDIGPSVTRVEGSLIDVSDTAYVLAVRNVMGQSGVRTRWSGERVALSRDYVARTFERRFSRSRTTLVVSGVVAAVGAFFFGKNLLGIGGGDASDRPGGGDPNKQ
jgi:hypothetical protein